MSDVRTTIERDGDSVRQVRWVRRVVALNTLLGVEAFMTETQVDGITVDPGSLKHAVVIGVVAGAGRDTEERTELTQGARAARRAVEAVAERDLRRFAASVEDITHHYDERERMLRSRGVVWERQL